MEKEEISKRFVNFLREKYYQSMLEAVRDGVPYLEIDFKVLDEFDTPLSEKLMYQPDDTLKIFEGAIKEIDLPDTVELKFRFRNLPEFACIPIRHLRAQHIGQFISVEGTVRRSSEILPEISTTIWTCPQCSSRIFLEQNERTMKKPVSCDCGYKGRFELFDKKLVDTRWIQIEEPFESTEGEKPSQLNIYLRDDLTSPRMRPKTDAGNRLRITGVMKEVTKVTQKGKRSVQLDILLAANHVETTEIDASELKITPGDEQKILELSKDPNIYEKIVDSIATSTYGLREIKEAIAYQLFSGVPHVMKDGTRVRGDIHILLIGEPSTGKSQLLKLVSKLANRGRYVSGKGVTSVGLTASVIKDEQFSGGWVLEAGAIVLANKGVCNIDEFEKMHESDQVALHEAMEQQSYHPDTEIMMADGTKHKIGELVEKLFSQNKNKIVQGVNCEILPTDKIEMLTTDFKDIYPIKINRVSRHTAPKFFVKVTFSNGRSMLVTPEHPLFAIDGTKISTIPAERATTGLCVPAPAHLPITARNTELCGVENLHPNEKYIKTPSEITPELATALGYYASEGHNFTGARSYEIGFTNSNPYIINDMVSSMENTFSITPYIQTRKDGVSMIRYSSVQLMRFFKSNFAELLQKARRKSIPDTLISSSKESIESFLTSAFLGDGFVDSGRCGYCTTSQKLAKCYQELLLSRGIYSYITLDRSSDMNKVVVSSVDSMKIFLEKIVDENDRRKHRIEHLIKKSSAHNRNHELPQSVAVAIKDILSELKMDDGYFHQSKTDGCGVTKNTVEKYAVILKSKASEIEKSIKTLNNPAVLRKICGISQKAVQDKFGINHSTVSYIERKNSHSRRKEVLGMVKILAGEKLVKINCLLEELKILFNPNLKWLTVKSVEIVPNENTEWVYDVTVEPTKSFISECLILHNTVSVAKASIMATLPAQTSVLAAANPKFGRFDFMKGIAEQVTVPETLLSRFDLKFALFDVPDAERDKKIADHIMKSRTSESFAEGEPLIDPILMRKYVAYARKNCFPKMTVEVGEMIKKFYIDTRAKYIQRGPISITPRQYEALIRMTEASAKIRLSPVVTEDDARRAIKLLQTSLQQLGLDKDTGIIDIDKIESGTSSSQRNKILTILDVVESLTKEVGKVIPIEDVLAAAMNEGINESDAMEVIERLKRDGQLMEPKYKHLQKV